MYYSTKSLGCTDDEEEQFVDVRGDSPEHCRAIDILDSIDLGDDAPAESEPEGVETEACAPMSPARRALISAQIDRFRAWYAQPSPINDAIRAAMNRLKPYRPRATGISAPGPDEMTGSWESKERARKARNARDCYRRKKRARAATTSTAAVTKGDVERRLEALRNWTKGNDHRQRRIRGREVELVRAWGKLAEFKASNRRDPSRSELAVALGLSLPAARKRLELVRTLSAPGGPLH
jgi:hypothetical protein